MNALETRMKKGLDPEFRPRRAAAAGAIAAMVYLAIMAGDMAATGSPSDDLLLLGRPLTEDKRTARLLGLAMHIAFGTCMGMAYGAVGRRRLRGPGWLRGVQMMLAENTALWPLTFIADRFHPAVKSGELPRFNRPIPFIQQLVRHVGFGAAMGALYRDSRSTTHKRKA